MTPKEKAKQLFDKFFNEQIQIDWTDDQGILKNAENNYLKNKDEQDIYWQKLAIHSALIAVDEILEFEKTIVEQIKNHVEIFKEMKFKTQDLFWKSVKQEIEKL